MIVQEEHLGGVNKKTNLASENYVIVKNHVRELKNITQIEPETYDEIIEDDEVIEQKVLKVKKRKRRPSNTDSADQNSKCCEINKSDLEELKAVYNKCKKIMKNIENKYGHLLNIQNESQTNFSEIEEHEEECKCQHNKKILFDDEGRQILKDSEFDKHICVKKHETRYRDRHPNIQVEYEHERLQRDVADLPDNLNDLEEILKCPTTENQLRKKVLYKIRGLRFDYVQEMRFNRKMLVEKLKSNPDDILSFTGTNLSTLSGYPT